MYCLVYVTIDQLLTQAQGKWEQSLLIHRRFNWQRNCLFNLTNFFIIWYFWICLFQDQFVSIGSSFFLCVDFFTHKFLPFNNQQYYRFLQCTLPNMRNMLFTVLSQPPHTKLLLVWVYINLMGFFYLWDPHFNVLPWSENKTKLGKKHPLYLLIWDHDYVI